jgi:hypothetical protein
MKGAAAKHDAGETDVMNVLGHHLPAAALLFQNGTAALPKPNA